MKWSAYSVQGHSQGRSPGVPVTLSPLCKPFFYAKNPQYSGGENWQVPSV